MGDKPDLGQLGRARPWAAAQDPDAAGRRCYRAAGQAQQRGLARAVGADQSHTDRCTRRQRWQQPRYLTPCPLTTRYEAAFPTDMDGSSKGAAPSARPGVRRHRRHARQARHHGQDSHRAYTAADPRVRRLMNQAFFTKLHISDEHIVRSDLSELFASPSSFATTHHPRRSRPRMGGIRLQARARSGQFVRLDVPSTRGCESAMNGRWTPSGLGPAGEFGQRVVSSGDKSVS